MSNYSFICLDKCGCTFLPAWCTHIQSDSVENTIWILDDRFLVTEPEWLSVYRFSRIKINIQTVYLMNHTWPHDSQASLPSTPLSEKVSAWLHTQTLAGCWAQITHKEKWNGLLGEVVHTAHVWTPPYTDVNMLVTELHVQQTIQHNPEQKPTAWPYCRKMKPSHKCTAQHAGAFRHNKHSRPSAEKCFRLGWFCFPCQAKPQAASKTQPSTKTPQLPTGSALWENETTQRTSNYGFQISRPLLPPKPACTSVLLVLL